MILTFFSAFFIAFSGAIMPGSLLAYTLRKSLSDGPKAGFFIAAGHAVLELLLIILIFLGFGRILKLDTVTMLTGLIGGALLICLGIDMIRGAIRNTVKVSLEDKGRKTGGLFASGLIISATNPFIIVWWSAVGLGFILQSYETYGLSGIILYYTGHILADFTWYSFVSVLVGTTRRFIRENIYRIIITCLGVITMFFGVRFVYTALFK